MSAVNLDLARYNMIEQQVRPWDVLSPDILQILEQIPRQDFTPQAYKNLAYADTEIPLGNGQSMMHPIVEGRLLQDLDIKKTDDILEIGTGSGFVTACLASLGHHVTSIEIDEAISQKAAERLVEKGILNVSLYVDDATDVDKLNQRYDVIAITGSLPELPEAYKEALNVGGRLFVITGEDPVMEGRLITRISEEAWAEHILFETSLKPLINAEPEEQFSF